MQILERDIEQALVRMVNRHGGLCLKWVCPGWAGVPDRIILLPGARIMFVELKRPKGGKRSKLQEKWHEWLTQLGFHCVTAWSHEDVRTIKGIIETWMAEEVMT